MHDRIHRAYWNHENAMRSAYLDIRWTLVVAGFEALMNTRETDVAWQFRDRVRQLANEFQINLTDHDLRIAYRLRSKLVHAESFLFGLQKILPPNQHNNLYLRLESLLRENGEAMSPRSDVWQFLSRYCGSEHTMETKP